MKTLHIKEILAEILPENACLLVNTHLNISLLEIKDKYYFNHNSINFCIYISKK